MGLIAKNTYSVTERTKSIPQETSELKLTKPLECFYLYLSLELRDDSSTNEDRWMIRLTGMEVYNSVFNITNKIVYFEMH